MVTREICKICFQPNRIGFAVPDKVWASVVKPAYANKVICLQCFTRMADEAKIAWDDNIQFYPVSLVTHNV